MDSNSQLPNQPEPEFVNETNETFEKPLRSHDGFTFTVSFAKRIFMFICMTVLFFVIGNIINIFLIYFLGETTACMRIAAVIQDVFVFIVPAILTAVLITRVPARFLAIDRRPDVANIIIASLTLICSIPAINGIVAWNESIQLPAALAGVEQWMRIAEESARQTIDLVIGAHSVPTLLLSILIVGVMAGFSEELFFRGTLQRIFSTGGMNRHVAVVLTAFIFSAIHLQFYGFFGRFLLGLFFGYLLVWSRCLWLPILIHILNNTLYLVGNYMLQNVVNTPDAVNLNTIGTNDWSWFLISVALTSIGVAVLYQRRVRLR